MISIITPTYNRATLLKRVYSSLLNQTNKNFEWLIIDDGSTDETKETVKALIKEHKLKIHYFFKPNGGKPSAYNLGVTKAKGNLLLCLDSDDLLVNDAIDNIINDYEKIKNKNSIAGLVYNCTYINNSNNIIGSRLPNNVIDTYYNIYEKYKVQGDKLQVIKPNIALNYPFPLIKNEKFVPEALINNRISLKYNFLYLDKALMQKEYLTDGYSSNYFSLVKKNPLSNCLYFKELYAFKSSFYNVYGYLLFGIYGKIKFRDLLKEHKAKIKVILLYIPSLLISKLK